MRQTKRETYNRWESESKVTNIHFTRWIIFQYFEYCPKVRERTWSFWVLPTHLSGWMCVHFPRRSHQRLSQIQETGNNRERSSMFFPFETLIQQSLCVAVWFKSVHAGENPLLACYSFTNLFLLLYNFLIFFLTLASSLPLFFPCTNNGILLQPLQLGTPLSIKTSSDLCQTSWEWSATQLQGPILVPRRTVECSIQIEGREVSPQFSVT